MNVYDALTRPSPKITQDEDRYRARMLAVIVLVGIVLEILSFVTALRVDAKGADYNLSVGLRVVIFVGAVVAYGLSRSRHYVAAAWLAVYLIWVHVFGLVLLQPIQSDIRNVVFYLLGAVLLASMVLSARSAGFVAVVSVIGTLIVPALSSTATPMDVFTHAIIVGVLSIGILAFARHRDLLEYARRSELTESERHYRQLVEHAGDVAYTADLYGFFTYMSPSVYRLTGYTESELIGKRYVELVAPGWRDQIQKFYSDQIVNRTLETTLEFPILKRNGAERWIEQKATLVFEKGVLEGLQSTVRDVTERRQAEEALKISQSNWRTLVENIPGIVTNVAPDGTILFINRVKVSASVAEVIGASLYDSIPPESRDMVREKIEGVFRTGNPDSYDIKIPHKDDYIWYSIHAAAIISEGQVDSVLLIADDITEQKQAEEAIRASENRFRAMSEVSPLGIFLTDPDGRCLYTNATCQKIMGAKAEDVLGAGWGNFIHPEDKEHVEMVWQLVSEKHEPFEMIYRFLHKDGAVIWANVKSAPMWDGDSLLGYVGTVDDISERQAAEETLSSERNLLRTVIDNLPDFVYLKDVNHRYLLNNIAHARSLGTFADGVVGKTDFDFFPLELAQGYHDDEERVLESGQPLVNHDELSISQDGNPIWATTTKVVLRNHRDEIVGIVGITRDVTERRRDEEDLREARDHALEASRLKSEFLATMSHEIRTPMNGIMGMTELLLATPLNDEQQDYAGIVLSEAKSLLTIINDILDFSKIEAGKMILETIDFNLQDTINRVVTFIRPKADEKGLTLKAEIAPDVPDTLRGDPGRLRQILLNLVGNAVKFTRRGDVVVRVEVEGHSPGHTLVRFSVIDSGIGLTEVARNRLFQPFTQADGSTTRQYGGTGLGLVISKRLAEQMDGEIGVESTEGEGSTFWFTANLENADEEQVGITTATVAAVSYQEDVPVKTDFMILVAEDNLVNQSLALKQLRELGYRARLVGNGVEVLDETISYPGQYSLVLMDCNMPVMDGYEATRLIRQDEANSARHVPIIAMTANSMEGEMEKCLAAGMDDYLSKPISLADLREMLARWIVGGIQERKTQRNSCWLYLLCKSLNNLGAIIHTSAPRNGARENKSTRANPPFFITISPPPIKADMMMLKSGSWATNIYHYLCQRRRSAGRCGATLKPNPTSSRTDTATPNAFARISAV